MLGWIVAAAVAGNPQVGMCRAGQIALRLDGGSDDFNGMSHSGTSVALRSRGAACRLEALPRIIFVDARGRALPIVRNIPPRMHPGPVLLPMTIAAGDAAATSLRWVSGEVFDRSRCFSPARILVAINGRFISARLSGRICGPSDKPAGFDQPPLRISLWGSRDTAGA